ITFTDVATGDALIFNGGTANMGAVSTGAITNASDAGGANITIGTVNSTIASVTTGTTLYTGSATSSIGITADTITGAAVFGATTIAEVGTTQGSFISMVVVNDVDGVT